MTLCVAAACKDGKQDRIVIGTDWRVEGEISAGADIQDKLYWVSDNILVLVSGNVNRAVELRDAYRAMLEQMKTQKPPQKLTYLNIRRFVKGGVKLYERELADEVVGHAQGGLSHKEFREAYSRREFPDAVATSVFQKVEKQDLECDLIVLAFVDGLQYIFNIERSGYCHEFENFTVIGEGGYVAQAFLYLREHDSETQLPATLYHVYEAMQMSRRCVGTVGKEHTINVLYPPRNKGKPVAVDFLVTRRDLSHRFSDDILRLISQVPLLVA